MKRSPMKTRTDRPRCRTCSERFTPGDAWQRTCDGCREAGRRASAARLQACAAAPFPPRPVAGNTKPPVTASAPQSKRHVVKSRAIRDSARGQTCAVAHPATCNHDPSTVVLAHLPSEIAGYKSTDICAVFACSGCHAAIDAPGTNTEFDRDRDAVLLRALIETQTRWIEIGALTYRGQAA